MVVETGAKLVSSQLRHCCYDACSGGGRWDLIDTTVLPSPYQQAREGRNSDDDTYALVHQNRPGNFNVVVVYTFRCAECGNIEQVRQSSEDDLSSYFGRIVNLLKKEPTC